MTGRSCSAQSPLAQPAQGGAGAFRSFLEREFNAPPKTPPSHGFRGFVAIKQGAERACRGPRSLRSFKSRAAKPKPARRLKVASWGVLSIRRAIRQSLPDGGRPGGCEPSGRHAWRWPGTACAWQRSSRSDGEPGNAGPAAIKHGIDKQAVAPRPCSWLTGTPGQPILDALPLTVAQCVSFGYGPSAGFSPPPGFRFDP